MPSDSRTAGHTATLGPFAVFAQMVATDNKALRVYPDVIGANFSKAGTKVTIGCAGNICTEIAMRTSMIFLLVCDKTEYEAAKVAAVNSHASNLRKVEALSDALRNIITWADRGCLNREMPDVFAAAEKALALAEEQK